MILKKSPHFIFVVVSGNQACRPGCQCDKRAAARHPEPLWGGGMWWVELYTKGTYRKHVCVGYSIVRYRNNIMITIIIMIILVWFDIIEVSWYL